VSLHQRDSDIAYFLFDAFVLLIEAGIHLLSILPGVWLVYQAVGNGFVLTSVAIVVAWFLSALLFVLVIVGTKILIGKIRPGRFVLTSQRAIPWMIVDRLLKITNRSPYRNLVIDHAFYRYLYFRGMGADIKPTLLLGQRVVIPEPYFLRVGHHVLIGDEAVLSAHKVEHNVVTLEPIEIGDNVLIGARALIMPGVKIHSNATIAAGAVLPRGTVVAEGETWAGHPATKTSFFPSRMGKGETGA